MRSPGQGQGWAGDLLHFCLSVSLWVFLSPAGTVCVKTGPLLGRHLPILDTHFLSPQKGAGSVNPLLPIIRSCS